MRAIIVLHLADINIYIYVIYYEYSRFHDTTICYCTIITINNEIKKKKKKWFADLI